MAARSAPPPPWKIDTYYRFGEIAVFVVFVVACAIRGAAHFQDHWVEAGFLFLCAAGSQAFRIRVSAVDETISFGMAAGILGLALPSPDLLDTVLVWVLGLAFGAAVTYRDMPKAGAIGGRQVLIGMAYATTTSSLLGWGAPLAVSIFTATAVYIAVSLLLWRLPSIVSDDEVVTTHFIAQRILMVFLLNATIPIITHYAEPQAFEFILGSAGRMKLVMDLTVTTAVFSVIALIMYGTDARYRLDGVIRTARSLPWPDDPDPLQQMKDFAAATLKVDHLDIRTTPPRSRFEIGASFRTHSGEERYLIALRNPGRSPLLDRDREALSAIAHIGQETMRVRGEANELRTEANTDSLTGLFNYRGFQIAIDDVRARRSEQGSVAVVYIDLDGFKLVNDRYGHDTGNHVLREVAHRLQEAVRPRDTVARVGGDEFVILLRDIKDQEHAEQVAHRIVAAASAPVALIAHELPIKLSLGVAFSDDPAESLDRLVTAADSLMYAKRGRRLSTSGDTAGAPDLPHSSLSERANAIAELITEKQLRVEYQPIVDAARGTVVAVEALVRASHPAYGTIEPSLLVHEAKRLDLLDLLTEQVLDRTFADYPRIAAAIPSVQDVHVNLELGQISRGRTQASLQRLCSEHPEVRLTVEMTENSLNLAGEDVLGKLKELRAAGIKLALDDFGQGYSTMLAIVEFPFDALKIDRSLIATITSSAKSNHVIRSLARLCRSLHVSMIVEGVERIDERDVLLRLGAKHMQGFLFSPSLTADALIERYAGKGTLVRVDPGA
ncbi:MAG TPA: bifunctional diguanylate cyclase/phosphodiesterase [Propionicimonas sp.]|uniref:putative bifunctional diguanylate cyclase/phosphodiesterase n=1 Tax=Propionicimonas sp. TaxID=1955623 RepID=UPI002F3F173E